jgi:hypothetical protein
MSTSKEFFGGLGGAATVGLGAPLLEGETGAPVTSRTTPPRGGKTVRDSKQEPVVPVL